MGAAAVHPPSTTWQQVVQLEQTELSNQLLTAGVLRDPQAEYLAAPPSLDFTSRPEVVRAAVDAHRLAYGHLYNPTFATEISLIEPLPHQRLAVYEQMLPQTRLRFLLADDAGAGKTIMSGLYIREMLSRRLIQRVLIVPPAGLVGNWERELRTLFRLPFRIVGGADFRQGNNPFLGPESHLLIVSLDTLAGERAFSRLQDPAVAPYDLVIFDEGVSLRQYMEQATTENGATQAAQAIEGRLTKEQVEAIRARERRLYGDGGDVRSALPRLNTTLEQEVYHRLLPGSVRRFIQKAAPLLHLGIEGDLERTFTFRALVPGALDFLWPVLERATPEQRAALTVYRPASPDQALFLHPGEPVFECLRSALLERFHLQALQGAVVVDPSASHPYLLHIAQISVLRQADPTVRALNRPEILEQRLIGLLQAEDGTLEVCPVERLLLLQDSQGVPSQAIPLVARADALRASAQAFAGEQVAAGSAEQHRQKLRASLEERERFIKQGYAYQEAELAEARNKLRAKADAGDAHARGELTRIKARQQTLEARKEEALAILRREIELIVPGPVTFLAHALIVPSSDPEDQKRQDARVEAIAMQYVRAEEEARGAVVKDVSTVRGAQDAGLQDHPGFDLLAVSPNGQERAIEVKGRAGMGRVELTENEWVQACNLGERYWLYVVYDCASAYPRLLRISDPFRKLIAKARGSVIIDQQAIMEHAEPA